MGILSGISYVCDSFSRTRDSFSLLGCRFQHWYKGLCFDFLYLVLYNLALVSW